MLLERLIPPPRDTDKNRIITVTGVSGSGKDFLIDHAAKVEPSIVGSQITVFNFGSELLQSVTSAIPEMASKDNDYLKSLPLEVLDFHIQTTLDRLMNAQPALQLTHLVFKQRGSLVINPENEKKTDAIEYFFVQSDPEMIYKWRLDNLENRKRDIESVDDIAMHQTIARAATTAIAMRLNSGLIVLNNNPQDTTQLVSEMLGECRNRLITSR